jgi:hypothetical protein
MFPRTSRRPSILDCLKIAAEAPASVPVRSRIRCPKVWRRSLEEMRAREPTRCSLPGVRPPFGRQPNPSRVFSKSNVDGLIVREQVENLRQKRTEFGAQHCRRISKRSQHLLRKGKSGACHSRVISRSCNCRAFTAALSPQRGEKRNRDEIDNHEFCFALVARATQPSRSPTTQLRVS